MSSLLLFPEILGRPLHFLQLLLFFSNEQMHSINSLSKSHSRNEHYETTLKYTGEFMPLSYYSHVIVYGSPKFQHWPTLY